MIVATRTSVRNLTLTAVQGSTLAVIAAGVLAVNRQLFPPYRPVIGGLIFLPISIFFLYLVMRAVLLRVAISEEGIRVSNYFRTTFIPWSDYASVDDQVGYARFGRPYWTVVVLRKSGKPVKVMASAWYSVADKERFMINTRGLIRAHRPVNV